MADAGWLLLRPPLERAGSVILMGAARLDGSCRPLDQAVFVFARGRAVGRIKPVDAARTRILRVALDSADRLALTLDVWESTDPRCCPSRQARIELDLRRLDDQG